jgi:ABC-2 type transport system ATP-binding protein
LIRAEQLNFRYAPGAPLALDSLSLRVPQGSLYGLLGPNGSGKTTFLSLLAGVLPCPPGHLSIAGHDLGTATALAQRLSALVPQDLAFYPRLSVQENLDLFAGVMGFSGADARGRVDEALRLAALGHLRAQRAETCSGGLKRRLNIAIGLLNRPRLLLLDEPTVGIDPQSRRFILQSVQAIHEAGTTVVYTSHYMEEVQGLCDTIGVMDRGRLLAQGGLKQLLKAPRGGKKPRDLEQLFLTLTHRALRD